MKKMNQFALLTALGLALAGTAAYAQPNSADATPAQAPDGPPGRPGPGPGRMILGLLDQYDANKDGQLDQTELAQLRKDVEAGKLPGPAGLRGQRGPGQLPKDLIEKYDLNKDGKLDESERAALRADVEAGKIQPPGPGLRGQGRGGPDALGAPSAKDVLQKFDTDKDGKLDEAELTAFLKDMAQHRPPMRGRRGPGGPGGPGGPPPAGDAPGE